MGIRVHQPADGSPDYEIGDVLYLGRENGNSYNQVYRNAFYVSAEPLVRNGNREELLHGWLGNFNDVSDYAEGKARVSSFGRSSCDCQSPECTEGEAVFVTRVGDHRAIKYAGAEEN